ncbi:MAG: zinc-ribbon domain-containing protein [Sneathiella sp.]|nr:zinc-ribbon domain-containing protein [Sneathiella sp.]
MILTCSTCSTRYLIDPASVGAAGRTVKCAKCGHKWKEYPPSDLPKQVADDEGFAIPSEPAPAFAGNGMSIEEMTTAPTRKVRPVAQTKKSRGWLGWLIFVFLLGGIGAGGFYGKQYVVQFWPATAKMYQALKIDVKTTNTLGLEIRELKTKSVLENGVVHLTVTGKVVNLTATPRPIPRISIRLVDGNGDHVYSWSMVVDQENVEPWGSAEFSSSMKQPPEEAKHVKADLIAPKKATSESKH